MGIALRGAALVCLLLAAPASAATFTKIADAASHPLAGRTFVFLGTPALDAGVVALTGLADGGGLGGVYTGNGGALTTVVDTNTPPLGLPFFGVHESAPISISQGNVAFVANESGLPAVWASLDGTLTRIADYANGGEPITIDPTRGAMIDGRNVAFSAFSHDLGDDAIFTSVDGVLEMSAGVVTLPGGAQVGYTNSPVALDGTSVAFFGSNATTLGFYVAEANVGCVVVDGTQTLPGYEALFGGSPDQIAMDAGNLAFVGFATLASDPLVTVFGIYAEIGGVLFRIADSQMLIPGEAENFLGFRDPAISGDTIAFMDGQDALDGLYAYRDGQLIEVLAVGDGLDGKVVSSIDFGSRGLSGDQLALRATFEDGTFGVYLATIPEPGTAWLLALGLLMLALRCREAR